MLKFLAGLIVGVIGLWQLLKFIATHPRDDFLVRLYNSEEVDSSAYAAGSDWDWWEQRWEDNGGV